MALRFKRSACFYVTITGHFERFQQFNFETDFLKKKLEYHFLVESTKTEEATCPCTIALLETNVQANRVGSAK